MDHFDLQKFSLSPGENPSLKNARRARPHQKRTGRFLKGPISWNWLCAAAILPGKALHVGLVIQFLSGLKKSQTVPLASSELACFGIERTTGYRALRVLEDAHLVSVDRGNGRHPRVTILISGSDPEA